MPPPHWPEFRSTWWSERGFQTHQPTRNGMDSEYTDLAAHHSGGGGDPERAALRDVVLLYSQGIPAEACAFEDGWSVYVHPGAYGPAAKVLQADAVGHPRSPIGTLFTSTQASACASGRARLTSEVLAALRMQFNIKVVGHLNGTPLVILDTHPHYWTTWYVSDNGGELNVGPVNGDDAMAMRSIPYLGWGTLLDPGTIAYRIAAVIRDDEIDYDARYPRVVIGSPPSTL